MLRTIPAIAFWTMAISSAPAQDVGMPGVMYSGMIAGGHGCQLYPFDRQDPWLHGQFQRMPAYGGFNSFRPYNYRHVFAQTRIATDVWGAAHGLPYSQQFWNRYRADYLNGSPHIQASASSTSRSGFSPASYHSHHLSARGASFAEPSATGLTTPAAAVNRPIHVYPPGIASQ